MFGKTAVQYALYGGEDFQLVFTIAPDKFKLLEQVDIGARLTVVGEVTDQKEGILLVAEDGHTSALEAKGYNHFR